MLGSYVKETIGERIEQVWDLGSGAVSRRQRLRGRGFGRFGGWSVLFQEFGPLGEQGR